MSKSNIGAARSATDAEIEQFASLILEYAAMINRQESTAVIEWIRSAIDDLHERLIVSDVDQSRLDDAVRTCEMKRESDESAGKRKAEARRKEELRELERYRASLEIADRIECLLSEKASLEGERAEALEALHRFAMSNQELIYAPLVLQQRVGKLRITIEEIDAELAKQKALATALSR